MNIVNNVNTIRFIDVCGVGNAGKAAVVDLLGEIDNVYAPEYWFEFDLIRVPDGLIDLRRHLVDDWSPIRSHAAVHMFINVVHKMGADPAWWDLPGLFKTTSQRYDGRFNKRFIELSEEFVRSFVIGNYRAEWPYDSLRESSTSRFTRKVLRRLGFRKRLAREVLLVDGEAFDARAYSYLSRLYQGIISPGTDRVVLNNGFEPFNPSPCLDMLPGSRQIALTRDPRDIYVSGLNRHNVSAADTPLIAFDNDGMNKSFLATDDLDMFVKRYRVYREKLYQGEDSRILHLRFEDLVLNYKSAVDRILAFLGIDVARHTRRQSRFQPEKSAQNIGIWRQYSGADAIRYIERQLPEYLVEN